VINSDGVSRHHATITLNYGLISIEDHGANGSFLYSDKREVYLINESMKLVKNGYISFGRNSQFRKEGPNVISYVLCGEAVLEGNRQLG
jgi:pSer/pThr/pTyr-binding forkhead associated (FHA) protein